MGNESEVSNEEFTKVHANSKKAMEMTRLVKFNFSLNH
jgi:hypothetical protein